MFDNIFAAIEKWMRELLSGMVESNLSTMFTAVNQQTSEIAAQVGQTPQGWNSSIFSMIRNISDSVVIPIAGIIITLILCYELISMLNQASGDRQILAKQLNISPFQLSYVTNSNEGEGLLFYGNTIIPFKDKFDTSLKLYGLMTTKPNEIAKYREKKDA